MTAGGGRRRLWVAALVVVVACSDTDAATAPTSVPHGAEDRSEAPEMAFPAPDFDPIDPAAAGFDPAGLDELVAAAEASGSYCLAVTRNGRLVGEWNFADWTSEDTTLFFSATKSMASTLVGIAQDEGLLDIDDRASDYITEWRGTPSESVTVRDLLSNDSGRLWTFPTDYLQMPVAPSNTDFAVDLDQQHEPGAEWQYNNAAIQTLEAVLDAALDEDPVDFARSRLLEPLGMEGQWRTDPSGNLQTYMGYDGSCGDALRFGNLALAGGRWGEDRVVSEGFLAEATGQPSQDLNQAYGFLWWRNVEDQWENVATGRPGSGPFWPGVPEDAYAALGLGGQTVAVHPSSGIVLARLGAPGELGTNYAPVELQQLVDAALVDRD